MRDETVHVSVSEEEKRRIRAMAGERDLSMSEFGREVLTEWLEERDDTHSAEN